MKRSYVKNIVLALVLLFIILLVNITFRSDVTRVNDYVIDKSKPNQEMLREMSFDKLFLKIYFLYGNERISSDKDYLFLDKQSDEFLENTYLTYLVDKSILQSELDSIGVTNKIDIEALSSKIEYELNNNNKEIEIDLRNYYQDYEISDYTLIDTVSFDKSALRLNKDIEFNEIYYFNKLKRFYILENLSNVLYTNDLSKIASIINFLSSSIDADSYLFYPSPEEFLRTINAYQIFVSKADNKDFSFFAYESGFFKIEEDNDELVFSVYVKNRENLLVIKPRISVEVVQELVKDGRDESVVRVGKVYKLTKSYYVDSYLSEEKTIYRNLYRYK